MNNKPHWYILNGVTVPITASDEATCNEAANIVKRKGLQPGAFTFRLFKKSVDARRKNDIRFVCSVLIGSDDPIPNSRLVKAELRAFEEQTPVLKPGSEKLQAPPLVVGMGPAGLFAALLLAQNGYAPILIDRGEPVEDRARTVEHFCKTGILDPESNIQFGAGGAGTFSDGKLVTRIHDPYCNYVLQTLHRFGAPDEILTLAKPHIGTDQLRKIILNILNAIQNLGGKVMYRCRLDDFIEQADGTMTVVTNCGNFSCGAIVLAPGHSARDTYRKLIEKQFAVEAKPISVGVRIEHLQSDIDKALYGDFAGHPNLGHAEYALSDTNSARGVYTFCMCPGGEVVAAASEEGGLVVNGMSNHARNGKNANAAVAVSVFQNDFQPINGSLALGAIEFQRKIERAAFSVGGGNYTAPVMTLADLQGPFKGRMPSRIQPTYRSGNVRVANIRGIFPDFVIRSLQYAFTSFGKKIEGYDSPDAVLTAAETRTSAPLRILRLPEIRTAIGHPLIYPCGEGAGYAGGITSAAVDGLRSAEALIRRFSNS